MTYSVTALKLLFSTVDYFQVIAVKLRIIEHFLGVELSVNINRKHQNFARLTFSTLRTHVGGRKMKVTNFIFEWHPSMYVCRNAFMHVCICTCICVECMYVRVVHRCLVKS